MKAIRLKAIMETERACVKRAGYCNRNCARCDLVMEDSTLLEAYNEVIALLDRQVMLEKIRGDYEFDREDKKA